jgi:hypothetical protein
MFNARNVGAAAVAVALAGTMIVTPQAAEPQDAAYSQVLADMNVALAGAGINNIRIHSAEISVTKDGVNTATTLIANDRSHRISTLFVEGDPRRGGSLDLSYLVDQSDGAALAFANPTGNATTVLTNEVTEPIIDRAMRFWQNEPSCPGPAFVKIPDDGSDPDLVDALFTGNPALFGTPLADITHAGWLPSSFFNLLVPNGSQFILGVTLTLSFVDDEGNLTDVDGNGRADSAFSEIYYNRGFGWSENALTRPRGIDIDSVVTHEAGHAVGLGHFGKVFLDNNGALKYAPRSIMNAVYISPFTQLAGTDNASFCSIWANRK